MALEWVPIVLFISSSAVAICFLILHFKHKHKLQETLQLAIEKGQILSPETVDSLLTKNKPFDDLKKAIILLTLGLGISVFLALLPNSDAMDAIAIGTFPAILGLGYIIIWKLRPKYDV